MGSATTTRWQQVLNGQRQLALGGFLAPLKEEEEDEGGREEEGGRKEEGGREEEEGGREEEGGAAKTER